ncbi:MAG: hypothetical protein RLZZ383_685 [Pseudomonadota bacterium]|jgi:hypothetical protein
MPLLAASLRLWLVLDGSQARVEHARVMPDERARDVPGELAVRDAAGRVLATAALPPLAGPRSVILSEGHGVGDLPTGSRRVRVTLPWPEGAASVDWSGQRLPLPGEGAPAAPSVASRWEGAPEVRLQSGPSGERLDLLILAEGYTSEEQGAFEADYDRLVAHLAQTEPYDTYRHLLNVWTWFVPSTAQGIGPSDGVDAGTAFGCYRGCDGIDRLVCCDEARILDAVAEAAPFADGVLLLANDDGYGGSGGFDYAVATTGVDGPQVATHELAHSLVLLWDEYSYGYDGDPDGYISPNCAPEGRELPWAAWIGDDTPEIGTYPGCSFTNWVRPTQGGCTMANVYAAFCPVCREHLVRSLYAGLGGRLAASVSPPEGRVRIREGETVTFDVDAVDGLRWSWSWEGEPLTAAPGALVLDGCGARRGTLTLTLDDPTDWVRNDPDGVMRQTLSWDVQTDRCEGDPPACGCSQPLASSWIGIGAALVGLRRRREGAKWA